MEELARVSRNSLYMCPINSRRENTQTCRSGSLIKTKLCLGIPRNMELSSPDPALAIFRSRCRWSDALFA